MDKGKMLSRIIVYLIVIILQLIMTQVVTFVATLFIPSTDDFPQTNPILFTIILGLTFSVGVFLPGWLAIKFRWLPLPTRYLLRFAGALLGAYIPLVAALLIYGVLEAGNPFFIVSILGSIVGFYAMGWEEKKTS